MLRAKAASTAKKAAKAAKSSKDSAAASDNDVDDENEDANGDADADADTEKKAEKKARKEQRRAMKKKKQDPSGLLDLPDDHIAAVSSSDSDQDDDDAVQATKGMGSVTKNVAKALVIIQSIFPHTPLRSFALKLHHASMALSLFVLYHREIC